MSDNAVSPAGHGAGRRDHPLMRFFNTEGPSVRTTTTASPPLDRVNLDELLGLVRDKRGATAPARLRRAAFWTPRNG